MFSIKSMGSAQSVSEYFLNDYYNTDNTGLYAGSAFEELDGKNVDKKTFINLLDGRDPLSGERLVQDAHGKHKSGYDLTFSETKSISIETLLNKNRDVETAYKESIDETMHYVQSHFIYYRETLASKDGEKQTRLIKSDNAVWASFSHSESRALDPQAHVHNPLMNITRTKNGDYKAIEGRQLYVHQRLIGQIEQNKLAKKLIDQNYSIVSDKNGNVELDYNNRADYEKAKDIMSKRSAEMEKRAKELFKKYPKESKAQIMQRVVLETRDSKVKVDKDELFKIWEKELAGLDLSIKKNALRIEDKITAEKAVKTALSDLETSIGIFSVDNLLVKSLQKGLTSGIQIDEVEKAVNELVKNKEILTLKDRETNKVFYSTEKYYGLEKTMRSNFAKGKNSANSIFDNENELAEKLISFEKEKGKEIKGFALSKEDISALRTILTSKDRYVTLQGFAGVGKTASVLSAVNSLSNGKGYTTYALSFQGKAADVLSQELNVQGSTLDSFFNKIENDKLSLNEKSMLLIDENSMTSTKDMLKIQDLSEKTGARVFMAGDKNQIQSVRAGRVHDAAIKHTTTVYKKEIIRQKNKEHREIVEAFAGGNKASIENAVENQLKINEIKDYDTLIETAAERYVKNNKTLIVTDLNVTRDKLNNAIHSTLKEKNIIKNEKEFVVYNSKSVSDLRNIENYKSGNKIYFSKAAKGLSRAGGIFEIQSVDYENKKLDLKKVDTHTFMFESFSPETSGMKDRTSAKSVSTPSLTADKDNVRVEKFTISDVNQYGNYMNVGGTSVKTTYVTLDLNNDDAINKIGGLYERNTAKIGEGDKIVIDKNGKVDGRAEIKNGETGIVKKIDGSNITVKFGKKTLTIDTDKFNYLQHGFAVSVNKSQGMTPESVVYVTEQSTYNKTYVAISRGKNGYEILTTDSERFKSNIISSLEAAYDFDALVKVESGRENEKAENNEREIAPERNDELKNLINQRKDLETFLKDNKAAGGLTDAEKKAAAARIAVINKKIGAVKNGKPVEKEKAIPGKEKNMLDKMLDAAESSLKKPSVYDRSDLRFADDMTKEAVLAIAGIIKNSVNKFDKDKDKNKANGQRGKKRNDNGINLD